MAGSTWWPPVDDAEVASTVDGLVRHLAPSPERRHAYRPATWRPWLASSPDAVAVIDAHTDRPDGSRGSIGRVDLETIASDPNAGDDPLLLRLFIATMLWGSGTSNGRGPRYTAAAVNDARLLETLRESRRLVLDGDPAEAFQRFRVDGVGPPFFTKWLWAVALGRPVRPVPLILDSRVWASLSALGWDSRRAAGSTRRRLRYVAYLQAAQRWSELAANVESPEQVEQVLFLWAGGSQGG